MKPHLSAVLQGLFVVFLWATSYILIKIGLQDIPPLTFAGLRYLLAFACLLVVLSFNDARKEIKTLPRRTWISMLILGMVFYAITQGASFLSLACLPAITVNLLWSFSSVVVAILGIGWLAEKPTFLQWSGIALAVIGAFLFFYPVAIPKRETLGFIVAGIGMLANAVSSILGRDLNRTGKYSPLLITVVSMGIGAVALLVAGLAIEGIPMINLKSWGIIIWLAIVNTAFAFTLWNHTLRTLSAVESSIIGGTMLVWIPIFAVLFLGERLNGKEIIGLIAVGAGTLLVQLRSIPRRKGIP